jgi:hypothetical protein
VLLAATPAPTRRRHGIAGRVLIVAAFAGVLAAATVDAAPASATTHTKPVPVITVDRISPVDADGALATGYTVTHRYGDATCSRPSFETGTAYRCTTPQSSSVVSDPCWVSSTPTTVFCQPYPWSRHVVRLTVTGGYDDSSGFHAQHRPWGLRIQHKGGRCLYNPGSVVEIHGRTAGYSCERRILLAGSIKRSHQHWKIRAYRETEHNENSYSYKWLGWQRIRTAWFGLRSATDKSR